MLWSLYCSCLWNVLSLLVSLSLFGSVVCYCPMLLPLSCSCLRNFLSLPVSLYIVTPIIAVLLMLPILQTTQIKLKPKYCIFLVKSLYIQFTHQLLSTVSRPNNVRYTSAPNSHKCKPSKDEIPSQRSKR